jgi:hypothetical protein
MRQRTIGVRRRNRRPPLSQAAILACQFLGCQGGYGWWDQVGFFAINELKIITKYLLFVMVAKNIVFFMAFQICMVGRVRGVA